MYMLQTKEEKQEKKVQKTMKISPLE